MPLPEPERSWFTLDDLPLVQLVFPAATRHVIDTAPGRPERFPGAEETFPFGPETSVFKVAGKVFALSALRATPLRVSLKCDPLLAEQLREAHPAVLPGYHLNKRHWNTVVIDGSIAKSMLEDMIEDSYDLVLSKLPRSRRRALGWAPAPDEP